MLKKANKDDFINILNLNTKYEPKVSRIDRDWLEEATKKHNMDIWLLKENDNIQALLILVMPNKDYKSINYDYFNSNYQKFIYVDRIIVDQKYQGKGLGRKLYKFIADQYGETADKIACEVNLKPRNDLSLKFHDKLGFKEVGRQTTEGGKKEVSLLVKSL